MNLLARTTEFEFGDSRHNFWYPIALVTVRLRSVISIERAVVISANALPALYAALYIGGGRLLDLVGARRGFTLIMLCLSIACALHGFASGFCLLLCARFLLRMGERGGFPAAIRVVAEWISPQHRSTAVDALAHNAQWVSPKSGGWARRALNIRRTLISYAPFSCHAGHRRTTTEVLDVCWCLC